MLTGKNVVIVKSTDKDVPNIVKEYDRVYLEYASTDALEEYTKTTEGKDLIVDGKVWKGLKPKDEVTTAKPEDLIGDALAYFTANFPGPADKPNDPWLTMLEAASYGADLWMRNKIQAAIRPSKPLDKQAAIDKMVKLLKSVNPKMSDVKARERAVAMIEENGKENETEPVAA